jgi:hypothetical protein
MDDRDWMYTGHRSPFDFNTEWMHKTNGFLELAFGEAGGRPILALCPCCNYANRRRVNKTTMGKHLVKNGFTPNYTRGGRRRGGGRGGGTGF